LILKLFWEFSEMAANFNSCGGFDLAIQLLKSSALDELGSA
jgi:hypothetical protein